MGFQGWFQAWSQGSRAAKALDPWDRPGTGPNPSILFYSTQFFCCHPVLRPVVTLGVSPSFSKIFPKVKISILKRHPQGSPGVSQMGDATESLLPAPNYNTPVKDLEYKDLLTSTFTVQTSSKSWETWKWLIQVLRDLKVTHPSLERLESDSSKSWETWKWLIQVSRDLKMTHPSLGRLESDSSKKSTSSKPWKKWTPAKKNKNKNKKMPWDQGPGLRCPGALVPGFPSKLEWEEGC